MCPVPDTHVHRPAFVLYAVEGIEPSALLPAERPVLGASQDSCVAPEIWLPT